MYLCTQVARSGKGYDSPIEAIEDFTTVACTWLIVDKEVEAIFEEAFRRARNRRASNRLHPTAGERGG